jgi:membrane associated rhomboid family serine protease
MSNSNKIVNWFYEGGYPLTKALIVASILTIIVTSLSPMAMGLLAFNAPQSLSVPWTLLTYPLVTFDPIGLIFYGLMLWWVGSSLERSWGTRTFAIFFAALSVLSALGIALGTIVLGVGSVQVYYYLPLSALVVAWCALNPELEIRIYGIIPVLAKWVGVGTVLITFFTYARIHPLMGFFAIIGCAAAYYWIRMRGWRDSFSYAYRAPRPSTPKPKRAPRDDAFSIKDLNPFERIARARRKKQFQRLFEDDEK